MDTLNIEHIKQKQLFMIYLNLSNVSKMLVKHKYFIINFTFYKTKL